MGLPIDLERLPDMNDSNIMDEIKFILSKHPDTRTK
jgi:hypothetical protein